MQDDSKKQTQLTDDEREQFLKSGTVGEVDVKETDPAVDVNPKESDTKAMVDKDTK